MSRCGDTEALRCSVAPRWQAVASLRFFVNQGVGVTLVLCGFVASMEYVQYNYVLQHTERGNVSKSAKTFLRLIFLAEGREN